MNSMGKIKINTWVWGLALAASLAFSCNREDDNFEQVPRLPIDVTISLDLPLYQPLQNPGGWVYLQGGSQGLIVYRVGPSEIVAFDRHCTYQVENQCRIAVDEESNITAQDFDCCNSVFTIIDGVPLSGPARRPLLRYQTAFNVNANTVRIYN